MGPVLIDVVTGQTDDRTKICALLQLRELAQQGALGSEDILRLAEHALRQRWPLDPFVGCRVAQVLGWGSADVQAVLLDYVATDATGACESFALFVLALALATDPDPGVTGGLCELLGRPDTSAHLSDLLSTAVAARSRPERSIADRVVTVVRGAWASDVRDTVDSFSDVGLASDAQYDLAMLVCYAATKLRGLPGVKNALWEALRYGEGRWIHIVGPAWAQVLEQEASKKEVRQLKQLVESADEHARDVRALSAHMVLASLGVSTSQEMRAALNLVGTRYDEGIAFLLPVLVDVLANEQVIAELARALQSGAPGPALGAVRVADQLGPRGARLLPVLREVALQGETPLGAEARLAWQQLAGLDEHGRLRALEVRQPTAEGWTAVHAAAQSGDLEALKALTAGGADINVQTVSGRTPMGVAARAHRWDAVEFLMEHGAAWSGLEFSDAYVGLFLAVDRGDVEGVRALTGSQDFLRIEMNTGWPTLRVAAMRGNAAITATLIDRGADVNTTDDRGKTPLHYAAESGDVGTVSVLLAANAAVNARDKDGKTPLGLATARQHAEVAELLRERGAEE